MIVSVLAIISKRIKIHRNKKNSQNLHSQTTKHLFKKFFKIQKVFFLPLCSWVKRLNIKVPIFLKLMYRFYAIHTGVSGDFIVETDKFILKFVWNGRDPNLTKQSPKQQQHRRTWAFWFQNFLEGNDNQNKYHVLVMVLTQK